MAGEVRAGLAPRLVTVPPRPPVKDPLKERYFGKPVKVHVQDFAALFGLIGVLVVSYCLYQGLWEPETALIVLALSFGFVVAGYALPWAVLPLWQGWMYLAEKIGLVVTIVIMALTWGVMVIPTAVGLRIFGKKTLDIRFRHDVESFWDERDPKYNDMTLLERQY